MLIDDILRDPSAVSPSPLLTPRVLAAWSFAAIAAKLRLAMVVKADNVADHCAASGAINRPFAECCPNIAPPASPIWVEYSPHPDQHDLLPDRAGWLLDYTDDPRNKTALGPAFMKLFQSAGLNEEAIGWLVAAAPVWLEGGVISSPGTMWVLTTTHSGAPEGKVLTCADFFPDTVRQTAHLCYGYSLKIALAAISFMHCKNVILVDNPPHPEKLQRARQKRGLLPLVTYRTLKIAGLTTKHLRPPTGGAEARRRALHIARGHFADYRDGPGLFGKYHGLVWVPDHVRGGDPDRVIEKRYEVAPNKSIKEDL